MGQTTYAVLYGVEIPKDLPIHDDWSNDREVPGLLSRWLDAIQDKVTSYDKRHPNRHWSKPDGHAVYVPGTPYEATLQLVGFYVAVGASGRAGVPYLTGFPLHDLRAKFPDAYKAARRRWRRFAKWAAAQGHVMPKARVYLTEMEVA